MQDGLEFFLTYADNAAVGYFEKQGFTKEVTMPRERVHPSPDSGCWKPQTLVAVDSTMTYGPAGLCQAWDPPLRFPPGLRHLLPSRLFASKVL